ncbi:MAG: hypothetical protein KGY78_09865 [Anaerolineae bacterium]|nr:hypothetical protein [Anaerolineae bacterium]
MILPHTYAAGRLAEEHRMDTGRAGEHARLLRTAKPVRVRRNNRVLASLKGRLFSSGTRDKREKRQARLILESHR